MRITTAFALVASIGLVLVPAIPRGADATAEDQGARQESSRVRYARVYLAITRLDLQVANSRNAQTPNTIPKAVLAVFEEQVVLADQWLKQAESEDAGKFYDLAVKSAESIARLAQSNYVRALEVNRVASMRPEALERLRLKVELANLGVARAKELDHNSPVALLQFQVDRLREDVAELTRQQLLILDRN
jgi:hypothetical protein